MRVEKNTKHLHIEYIVHSHNSAATIIKRDFVFYAECKDVRCKSILRIGCILDGALPLSCLEWSTFIRAVGCWIT